MRSHYCQDVTEQLLEQEVEVCGWVHRRRDHGGVIFVDLRDVSGLLQVVFEPELKDYFALAETLRSEFVIKVKAMVRARPEGMINPELITGKVEAVATELEILNQAKTPPFQVDEHQQVSEEVRLRYRYIDMRRPEVLARFQLRANLISALRGFLEARNFLDLETPMLTKATPEGARDYLVPSRTHKGEFFALPQSPQLFKQLFMMAGVDRYYQIVKCFRDEDLRADRQPEFTQLDIETSFMDERAIQDMMEALIKHAFKTVLKVELSDFPRLTYHEAMLKYGSDKPDLRTDLFLEPIEDLVQDVEFKVFSGPAKDKASRVVAMRVPGACAKLTRKQLDDYASFVADYGAKGLAYIKVNDKAQGLAGLQSPILKFFNEEVLHAIVDRLQAETGDIIFFAADKANIVNDAMAAFRLQVSRDCGLLEENTWRPLWVVDFPMFERADGRLQALHHPFTAPQLTEASELKDKAEDCLSRAYDMVLNGFEIGGGSIRIHQSDMQKAVFELLGINDEEAQEKFGFLLEALDYGCPPLGGIAFGIDRIAMLMAGGHSLRDVIAFPKTQTAMCPLTNAPTAVSHRQLQELGIKLNKKD